MSLLSFAGVSKSFGDKLALAQVSFQVRAGEVFGLLGPNGAGKTTAIRIVMDIVRHDEGTVELFGKPIQRAALDRVSYLPEERGLYGRQRVLDIMTYFGALKGIPRAERKARARAWLERVGLHDVERMTIDQLSKGMGQKVQIAAALQSEPEVCILDEPFSGLDPVNAVLIRELISELRAAGRTVILSTHQMNMVEALCDRVALLSRGRLLVYDEVAALRRKHSSGQLQLSLEGALPDLPAIDSAERNQQGQYRVRLCAGVEPQALLEQLVQAQVRVERFEPVLASMEDIFIHLVSGKSR